MSYIQEFEFEFEVGDVYDLTPIEGSYVIGMILAQGGECYLDGNKIVVTATGKTAPAPAPVAVEPTPEPEPDLGGTDLGTSEIGDPVDEVAISSEPVPYVPNVVEEAIAASYEFVEELLDTVQAELEPPLEEEAPPEVKAAPIKRPRKPKVIVEEPTE